MLFNFFNSEWRKIIYWFPLGILIWFESWNLLLFKSRFVQCNCSYLCVKHASNILCFTCFASAKKLLSRLSGVKLETLFSSVKNNSHSNSLGRLMLTNNKLIMFSLSVLTLLFAIFILLYHIMPRFHVNDLLCNRIREKAYSGVIATGLEPRTT